MGSDDIRQFDVDDFFSNADGLRGSGGFGKVYLCRHKELGFVAVKCVEDSSQGQTVTKEIIKKAQKEANIMWDMKDPQSHIIQTHGYMMWDNIFGIVMEYAACGNLHDLLHGNEDHNLSLDLRLKLLKEIITGVNSLHSHHEPMVHGDLKPHNILLSCDLQVKIADLGSARHLGTISITPEKIFSTPGFTATELYENQKPSQRSDIYSYAAIAYEIVTKQKRLPPHCRLSDSEIAKQKPDLQSKIEKLSLVASDFHKSVLENLKEMITTCWHDTPEKRWPADKIKAKLEEWTKVERVDLRDQNIKDEALKLAEKIKYPQYVEQNESSLRFCFREPTPSRGAMKHCLVITGGQATKQAVVKFTVQASEWEELPRLNDGRCHHCSVVTQSKLFVMGGTDKGKVLKSVEWMDMKDPLKWSRAQDMNEARFLASAENLKDNIYVLGGKNQEDEILDSIEIFSTEQWTFAKVKLDGKRFNFSSFVYNDNIYCCGGMDQNGKAVPKIEIVNHEDIETKVLEMKQREQLARYGSCAVKSDETTALFLGGRGPSQKTAEKSVISYTVDGSWKKKNPMIMERCSFAAVVVERTIYALGGHGLNDTQSSLTTYERWDMKSKDSKWLLEEIPDSEKRNWAGHSMVLWDVQN